jgi:hypothetical protein
MFSIVTARDFLQKAEEDLVELRKDAINAGKAMNAVLSLYHVHDWLWANHLEPTKVNLIHGATIKSKTEFVQWLDSACTNFKVVQGLATATKHCILNKSNHTAKVEGFGKGRYGAGPYGTSYLVIDLGEELSPPQRFLMPHQVLSDMMSFWKKLFDELQVPNMPIQLTE